MKVIALLIFISLTMAIVFLIAFYKALKSGQFDDLESPGFRILDKKTKSTIKSTKNAERKL